VAKALERGQVLPSPWQNTGPAGVRP
jgi:hypothetical protein